MTIMPHAGIVESFAGWVQPTGNTARPVGCTHPTITHRRRVKYNRRTHLDVGATAVANLLVVIQRGLVNPKREF